MYFYLGCFAHAECKGGTAYSATLEWIGFANATKGTRAAFDAVSERFGNSAEYFAKPWASGFRW